MIDGYVDEYENAFLQDLSLSEFSHSLDPERTSNLFTIYQFAGGSSGCGCVACITMDQD